jgi:beta-galactosidase
VKYAQGELSVITYKNGKFWAEDAVKTTDKPYRLVVTADRTRICADGKDLSFVEVQIADKDGLVVPTATNRVMFTIEGPGEIIATDNGDPTNMEAFGSKERAAFSGLVWMLSFGKRMKKVR